MWAYSINDVYRNVDQIMAAGRINQLLGAQCSLAEVIDHSLNPSPNSDFQSQLSKPNEAWQACQASDFSALKLCAWGYTLSLESGDSEPFRRPKAQEQKFKEWIT